MTNPSQVPYWAHLRFGLFVLVSFGLAVGFTIKDAIPAAKASLAILKKDTIWEPALEPNQSVEKQRQIQAHYLSYGVYIPLDDIVIGAHDSRTQHLLRPLEGLCKTGSTAIWVPVAFHFPIFGEKVFEWCLVRT